MNRTSGECARCGKAIRAYDGGMMLIEHGPESGRLAHSKPLVCVHNLRNENAMLRKRIEKQDAIIERLSDQYTDAVLAAEEMERESNPEETTNK